MMHLISQVTFIFLTQIYYNMNFIKSSSNFMTIFADCFWRTIFCSTQKMHISEYVCKTCLKELGILLKYRETFETFLVTCNSSKNTGLPQFFSKVFGQLYFKDISFLKKTKTFLLC